MTTWRSLCRYTYCIIVLTCCIQWWSHPQMISVSTANPVQKKKKKPNPTIYSLIIFRGRQQKHYDLSRKRKEEQFRLFFFHGMPAKACFPSKILSKLCFRKEFLFERPFLFKTRLSPGLGFCPTFMNYY